VIACLGWGSLVWDPRELPVEDCWHEDGPMLRADFLRMSDNRRMTLVLDPSAPRVRSLWSVMTIDDVQEARVALAHREGSFRKSNPTHGTQSWTRGDPTPALIDELPLWCEQHRIDHVIWTAIGSRFKGVDRTPSADEVVAHLRGLDGDVRKEAETYIRRAPAQVMTPLRERIAEEFGWTPQQP